MNFASCRADFFLSNLINDLSLVLTLDAMDVSGEHQIDISHNIFKKRLGQDGKPIAVTKQEELGDRAPKAPGAEVAKAEECLSCYGAESATIKCCNTCESVREAYRQKGWAFTTADSIVQCVHEKWSEKLEEQRNEGCEIYGHLLVNKVGGNFHFAPGKSYQQQHMHVHDTAALSKSGSFNLSHNIVRLSFGAEFPGITNPLDNIKKNAPQTAMFQYFVKIVPTVYAPLSGAVINTNQFSVTENYRVLDHQTGGHGLPGKKHSNNLVVCCLRRF
jgi:endoplasmic reticulum-Golgi intermediate compartment protein 3